MNQPEHLPTPPFAASAAPPFRPLARAAQTAHAGQDSQTVLAVETHFRGVNVHTRFLSDSTAEPRQVSPRAFIAAGIAAAAIALTTLVATSVDVGQESRAFSEWQASGRANESFPWKSRGPAPAVLFFGGLVAAGALSSIGLSRRNKAVRPNFVIGSTANADVPAPTDVITAPEHPLISTHANHFIVNVVPGMQGEIVVDGHTYALSEYLHQRGSSFGLPTSATARLVCGETTFLISTTDAPKALEAPAFAWKWETHGYTLSSAGALVLLLVLVSSVPPDPKALSLDMFDLNGRRFPIRILPPVEQPLPAPNAQAVSATAPGGKGAAHAGVAGEMGDPTKKPSHDHYAIKKHENVPPRLNQEQARIHAETAGILGILKRSQSDAVASAFSRESATGEDAQDVLGHLVGNQIGAGFAIGGLGMIGTGAGGGDTGKGTLGAAPGLNTIGRFGGQNDRDVYFGRGVGNLAKRRPPRAPEIFVGIASVRGSLDKEIVRRTIRRHINEVKYCYEQELTRNRDLSGRILVQFTISSTGQVISSVIQNSTMGNARVETCTTQAVRRWEFPKPEGGGLAIVSYPFVLAPAGAGS